ncbi:MAG: hypothetical protein EU548_05500 [Promethearchaeota archaeon]|nr:MAG: hypothetical protein EU548_05500 [Candidatus Lokiarchaeota archaeon]
MNEKDDQAEKAEDYEAKLDKIMESLGMEKDSVKLDKDSKKAKNSKGIDKVDLEVKTNLDINEIEFEEEGREQVLELKSEQKEKKQESPKKGKNETEVFASKILDMVDLKQNLTDQELISEEDLPSEELDLKKSIEEEPTLDDKIYRRGTKEKKKEYVVSPVHTPVIVSWKAYKRMVGYAMRYANEDLDQKKWREVYGILIGYVADGTKVYIKDAIPMVVGDRAGVQYEDKQYVDMAQIDQSVYERSIENQKTDFIIGWWHTHPGFGFFYSEVDCYTQLGYQIPNPYAVGLIFDHCEKKFNFLGLAGLRLLEPNEGVLSDYETVELRFEEKKKTINKKIDPVIQKIEDKMPKVLEELEYIDKVLRRKALAQLQRNFGLILVPKRDVKVTDDEEEAEEDERFLYVWDPEFFKKSYRIPKFREKVEEKIIKYEEKLKSYKEKGKMEKFQDQREKYQGKIEDMLEKASEWYNRLLEDFNSRIEVIFPLYDYLDTNERKIIEHFEGRVSKYGTVLDSLLDKAKFELED